MEIEFQNTRLDNVLKYLYDQVKGLSGKDITVTRHVTHQVGTSNDAVYHHMFQNVKPPQNNRLEVPYHYFIERIEGNKTIMEGGSTSTILENFPDIAFEFEGWQLKNDTVLIKANYNEFFEGIFTPFWNDLIEKFGDAEQKPSTESFPDKPKESKPTIRTQERFKLFQSIKQKHPDWSQSRVAMEANIQENTEIYSQETVRNTYREIGESWERADRIR